VNTTIYSGRDINHVEQQENKFKFEKLELSLTISTKVVGNYVHLIVKPEVCCVIRF